MAVCEAQRNFFLYFVTCDRILFRDGLEARLLWVCVASCLGCREARVTQLQSSVV